VVLLVGCNGSDTVGGEDRGVSCCICPDGVRAGFFVLHCFVCREKTNSLFKYVYSKKSILKIVSPNQVPYEL
jgi:hypothetical protein